MINGSNLKDCNVSSGLKWLDVNFNDVYDYDVHDVYNVFDVYDVNDVKDVYDGYVVYDVYDVIMMYKLHICC